MSLARPLGPLMESQRKGGRLAVPDRSPATPVRAPDTRGPTTIVVVVGGRVARVDLPGLCQRVRVLLEGTGAGLVVCDVGAIVDPDAVTVDALARLQLAVRRRGGRFLLRHACDELRELLDLTGLSEVVPLWPGLLLEPKR